MSGAISSGLAAHATEARLLRPNLSAARRRRAPEAVLVALQFEAAAVDDELGPFLDAEIDIGAHLVEVLAGDERAHFRFGVGAGSDFERAHPRH
jgi:hypothetical protein